MNIKIKSEISFEDLESRLRSVPIKMKNADGSPIFVYRDAKITFREIDTGEVNPSSLYVLQKNLNFQEALHRFMKHEYGIDTLSLTRAYEIYNKNDDKTFMLAPPICEVINRTVRFIPDSDDEISYDDSTSVMIPVINDGLHRAYLARSLSRTFVSVWISGVDCKHPFYAHPNNWSEIKIYDEVPQTKKEKKRYLHSDCYGLYRDFSVLGCGAPRNLGNS